MNQAYLANFNSTALNQQPTCMESLRRTALYECMASELPTRRDEHWKYTDLSFLQEYVWRYPEPDTSITQQDFLALNESYRLVFVNGFYSENLSDLQGLNDKFFIRPIHQVLENQPNLIQSIFEKKCKTSNSLVNINVACMTDGAYIRLAKNSCLTKPLHILHLSTLTTPSLIAVRNIVDMGENSQASIVEEHLSLAQLAESKTSYWKNSLVQIFAAQRASLYYYKIQDENQQAVHNAVTEIEQQRDSRVVSYSFSCGSKLARDDLNVSFQESGASCRLYGLYLAKGQQHVDHHTRIDHHQAHCASEQFYKGILTDKATGVFNGKVIVHPGAQKTQSHQSNNNLLLSNTAEVNTKPELEIYADDVKCSHGATVGQIDKESLFYLQSRGIEESEAINLLTYAFAEDILTKVDDKQIAAYLHERISLNSCHPERSS